MSKIVSLFFLCFLTITLSGCGSSFSGQPVTFGGYTLQIDTIFVPSAVTRFETKRTKDRIIKAYIYPTDIENAGAFEKNMLVAAMPNTKNITSEQFAQVGIKTIQKTFQSYKKYTITRRTITCKKKDIEIYTHTYYIALAQNKELKGYYIGQAYFSDSDILYTISAGTDTESELTRFEEYFATIGCADTTTTISGQM